MLIKDLKEAITDPKFNPALMTWQEYINFTNKHDKSHPETAYNWSLKDMNRISYHGSETENFFILNKRVGLYTMENGDVYLVDDGEGIGFSDGQMFYISGNFPRRYAEALKTSFDRNFTFKTIKYLDRAYYQKKLNDKYKEYSILINRIKSKGKRFEIRKEEDGTFTDFAIFNDQKEKIAVAQDEWGATLVAVAEEYRGYGFGKILGKIWTEFKPDAVSGGYTPSGYRSAKRLWETFVREALKDGKYSKWVRSGILTKEKANAILKDLSDYKQKEEDLSEHLNLDDTSKWLVLSTDGGFVIYHRDLLELDFEVDREHDAEKYIRGFCFLRYTENRKQWFLYKIDYENDMAERLLILLSLQWLYDNERKSPLHFDIEAADYSENIKTVPNTIVDGDAIKLKKPVINLEELIQLEKRIREPVDQYKEKYDSIIELAHYKYMS
jgi:ribosomal protein S18 acetylase RimI-like enzyme